MKAWAIVRKGHIFSRTIRHQGPKSIATIEGISQRDWRHLRRNGYSLVRVKVTEVES